MSCPHGAHLHVTAAGIYLYLSHLLNAIGEDVSDDNPLLRRRPEVHLDQNNIVEQHEVAHVCHLQKKHNSNRGRSAKTNIWLDAIYVCVLV